MNEATWLTSKSIQALLDFACPRLSERKARLFACACCRRVAPVFSHPFNARALEVAERLADGLATEDEVEAAQKGLEESWGPAEPHSPAFHGTPSLDGWALAWALGSGDDAGWRAAANASRLTL